MAKIFTISGVALFSVIIYKVLFDHMIIITSSIFGAYCIVRGVSLHTGGYVNDFEIGDISEECWTMWLFWSATLILAIFGSKIQFDSRNLALDAFN